MERLVIVWTVGSDGVLAVQLPMGAEAANRQVKVTVEPVEKAAPQVSGEEAWQKFISETAGRWQGELKRPPQGSFEVKLT